MAKAIPQTGRCKIFCSRGIAVLAWEAYNTVSCKATVLFQIINQLSPLAIVDESHHACSELSLDMLKDFNPSFVLELTATPKKNSNILSHVDAAQLKAANMVKRPVIVYNRDSQQEAITDAIDLRRNLERLAEAERSKSGVPFPKNRTQKHEKTNEYPISSIRNEAASKATRRQPSQSGMRTQQIIKSLNIFIDIILGLSFCRVVP